MSEPDLAVIDGRTLSQEHRALLRPGEAVEGGDGVVHHLPRFFYSVASWSDASEIRVAAHFKLWELMMVDAREADLLLRTFPHYVPCAIAVLGAFLEAFRRAVDSPVFISANGGYRSPVHRCNNGRTLHSWGTAADIYRVGDNYLNDEKTIGRYATIAESLSREVNVRRYAEGDDHLHIDVGFVTVTPRECSEL